MIERVSSQLTLLIRIGLPTIWLTSILSLTVLLLIAVQGKAQLFGNPFIWLFMISILVSGIAFIYFVLWRIYRVDMDEEFIYVSNYFKTFKYPFTDVERISESNILPGRVYIIRLKSKGSFGKNVPFLASKKLWKDFVNEHPDIFREIYP